MPKEANRVTRQLHDLLEPRRDLVVEYLRDLGHVEAWHGAAVVLETATRSYVANTGKFPMPKSGEPDAAAVAHFLERHVLRFTVRLLDAATEAVNERRTRREELLTTAAADPGVVEAWAGLTPPSPFDWETAAPQHGFDFGRDPRVNILERPLDGRRSNGGELGLPPELASFAGSDDIAGLDAAYWNFLATETRRVAYPLGLADERSRLTAAIAIGLLTQSARAGALVDEPGEDADPAPIGDLEITAGWDALYSKLARHKDGVGAFDLVRAGFGYQIGLLSRLEDRWDAEWHPVIAEHAFLLGRRNSPDQRAWGEYLAQRLPFHVELAAADHAVRAAGAMKEVRKRVFNPKLAGSRDEIADDIRTTTLAAFYQSLLKDEQLGGYRSPSFVAKGGAIRIGTVNRQILPRVARVAQSISRKQIRRADGESGTATVNAQLQLAGEEALRPRSEGDGSAKRRAAPWVAVHLEHMASIEGFWRGLRRFHRLPDVPVEVRDGYLLHREFLEWLARDVAWYEGVLAARLAMIEHARDNDQPIPDVYTGPYEEWLRSGGSGPDAKPPRHYPGGLEVALRRWSRDRPGLLSDRQRNRERWLLEDYLTALHTDSTWNTVATSVRKKPVAGQPLNRSANHVPDGPYLARPVDGPYLRDQHYLLSTLIQVADRHRRRLDKARRTTGTG
jgi:hypothetical protein